jgi:choline dehydrogenase-like flavoprotein
MLADLTDVEGDIETDIAIVGAGAVGLALAVHLARAGVEVAVCETGSKSFDSAAQALNEALLTGKDHAGVTLGRARILGGTTTLWGGQLTEFRDIDFRDRPWLGAAAWPIERAHVSPYYAEVAGMLGFEAAMIEDDRLWEQLGSSRPDLGPDLDLILTRWLRRPNFAEVFSSEILHKPNLTVITGATVTDFELSEDGAHVHALTLSGPSRLARRLKAKRVVVACGTIEANRLMLTVARNHSSAAWARNAWLGVGFQDHLAFQPGKAEILDKKAFADRFDNIFLNGFKYQPKIVLTDDIQRKEALTNIAGWFVYNSSLAHHLDMLKAFARAIRAGAIPQRWWSAPAHLLATGRTCLPLVLRYLRQHRVYNPADLGVLFEVHCEQAPTSESCIRLSRDRVDRLGMPLADLHWRLGSRETETIAIFSEAVDASLRARGLAALNINPAVIARDPSILDHCVDTNHQCGGLRMGVTGGEGVVDSDLRVHGTSNLYVAGAAVFPSSSFANPTFTALALALRLSCHLAEAA